MRYAWTLALAGILTAFAPATLPAQQEVRFYSLNAECKAGIRIIVDGEIKYGTVPCRDARVEFQVGPEQSGITGPASSGFYRPFFLTRFNARLRGFDMPFSNALLKFRHVGFQSRSMLSALAWDVSPTAPSGGNGRYKYKKVVDAQNKMDAPVFAATTRLTVDGDHHTVVFDDRMSEVWGYVDYAALTFSMVVKFDGERDGVSNHVWVQLSGALPRSGFQVPPTPPTPDEPIVVLGEGEEEPTEPVEPDDKPIPQLSVTGTKRLSTISMP
jgi:hypothetical protein